MTVKEEDGAKIGSLENIVFKAKERGTANFVVEGQFFDKDAKEIQTSFENIQVKVENEYMTIEKQIDENDDLDIIDVSEENVDEYVELEKKNADLEILAIENIMLSPDFDAKITKYNVEISKDISKLNILAIPQDEQANVQIVGKDNIKEGKNEVVITVTANDGITEKVYMIDVYKRNSEEQLLYNKEQSQKQEKLEAAYEVEKLSTKSDAEEISLNQIEKGKNNKIIYMWIAIIFISIVGIVVLIRAVNTLE